MAYSSSASLSTVSSTGAGEVRPDLGVEALDQLGAERLGALHRLLVHARLRVVEVAAAGDR